MTWFNAIGSVVLVISSAAVSRGEETPEFPQPQEEHQWLQQLAGDWESEVQMFIPGQDPVTSRGTEHVRKVGGFWIQAENHGDFMGEPFLGLLTLGYDADKQQYVGTWVDSMNDYLWTYEGRLDEAKKVLTLEAEGPCPMKPGELSQFREVLEIKSKDHKIFSSSIKEDDGKWITMMTINYRRTK